MHEPGGIIKEFDSNGRLIRVVNTARPGVDVRLEYNGAFLSKAIGADGRILAFRYENARLVQIVLPDGAAVGYGRDSDENLVSVQIAGRTKLYSYHEPGLAEEVFRHHLTGITYEDGQRHASFGYDGFGRVTSSRLHVGVGFASETSLAYDAANKVTVTSPAGVRTYTMGAGPFRPVVGIASEVGSITRVYNSDGTLQQQTDRTGRITNLGYVEGYETSRHEAAGTAQERVVSIERNTSKKITKRTVQGRIAGVLVEQLMETSSYDGAGRVVARCLIDPAVQGAIHYSCGSSASPPIGVRQSRTTYCEQSGVDSGACPVLGLVLSVDGARNGADDVTAYEYFAADHANCAASLMACDWRKGDLWKVTNSLGQTTETLRYDGAGRALSVKDPNGVITDFEYHPRGWLAARKVRGADNGTESDDQIMRIDYYPTGLVSSTTLPDGSFTSYVYDAAHRLTNVVDADGNAIHYTLDNAGNRIKEEVKDSDGSLKRTLSRVYNQLGQLQMSKDAANQPTGFTYDPNGNLDTASDALGRVSDRDYDPLNRLSRTLQDVAGIAAETRFKYDALDNLTEIVDPKGLSTKYQYNAFGDLIRLESPDTGVTTYGYDAAGNRISALDARGEQSTYSYDALNRLTGIAYSDAALNVSYTYDAVQAVCDPNETFAIGRLTRMDDGSGSTQYCYDRFGNLTRKVQVTNGQSFTLRYAYTKAGQVAAIQYPDGMLVDYVRDGLGRATEVGVTLSGGIRQVLLTGATYHPFGPVAGWTFGNGRTMSRTLDLDYRPKTILSTGTGAGGLNLGFGWDAVGNLASLHTSGLEQPPRITFGYDALGRLTTFQDGPTGAVIEQYAYDATGNRTSFTNAGGTQLYDYPTDSHRLSAVNDVARSYDAIGNTTSIGGTQREFAYNAAGRMSLAERDNAVVMQYGYNAKGEQVRRYLSTSNTYAVHDESGLRMGEYHSASAPTQQIVWLDSLPVGVIANGRMNYVEADHLGTPRTVIDAQLDVAVWELALSSEAFGNSSPAEDPDFDGGAFQLNMRFPGQIFDPASGLNYNYFRDYDAASGRYIESDPIGLGASISTYSYVGASPLQWRDPSGLVRWDGRALPSSAGGLVAGGLFVFDLTSQCVKGKRARVLVRAWGAGVGWGIKYLPPINMTADNVTLEDHLPEILPANFNGLFHTLGVSLNALNWGAGCTGYQLGSHWTPAVTRGVVPCTTGGAGLDLGANYLVGQSTLVRVKWSQCDECEPIDTPFDSL